MGGILRASGSRLAGAACLLLAAGSLSAQDRPLFPGQNQPDQPAATAAPNSDALSLLLDQNNQLRTELQALRALVEEQGFQLGRLQRDSLNRYTDLDARLQALESGAAPAPAQDAATTAAAAAQPPPADLPAAADPVPTDPPDLQGLPDPRNAPALANPATAAGAAVPARGRTSSLQPAVLSEQQLYQMAYESAINSNFERSIAEFDQYLSVYPDGRFVSNAHYWKGQSYLYLDRFGEARDAYEIILNEYGDSPKLPDAMFGLGSAYQGLGDIDRARELFNSIKRRYPNTGVANLADTRLLSLDD